MDPLDLEDGLTRLVDRSLVLVDRDTMRYRMLETIRQYARERLIAAGEAAALADRHLAVVRGPRDRGRGSRCVARRWSTGSTASMRSSTTSATALEWGLEAEPWTAVRMATALLPYWAVRVMSAGQRRPDRRRDRDRAGTGRGPARRRSAADQALAAKLLGEGARLWGMSGRATVALGLGARTLCASATRAATPRRALAALAGLGDRDRLLRTGRSGRDGCAPDLRAGADLAERDRRVVDPRPGGGVLRRQSRLVRPGRRSGPHAARRRGGATIRQPVRDRRRVDGAGSDARAPGQDRCRRGRLRRRRSSGSWSSATNGSCSPARSDMAHALRRGGRFDEALALYRETIGGWVHLGHKGAVANQLENIAYVDIGARPDRARGPPARRGGRAPRSRPMPAWPSTRSPSTPQPLERLRGTLMPAAFEAAWATGRAPVAGRCRRARGR